MGVGLMGEEKFTSGWLVVAAAAGGGENTTIWMVELSIYRNRMTS